MTAIAPAAPRTLADAVLPRTLVTDIALVVGFAALTALAAQISIPLPWTPVPVTGQTFAVLAALAAQISIPLPWTPVPVTGQTFAVLAAGTVLGAKRGPLSQLLYVLVGAIGAPIYADGAGGWAAATGATGGYLIGFVVAAAVVGTLSERRQDRHLLTALPAMLAGSALVYAVGVPWLAASLGVSGTKAIELGMAPFLIGDALKLVAAGALAPSAWSLVRRLRGQD